MKPLLPDSLWASVQRLLPPPTARRYRCPGRKPLDDRKILTGILFVLKTGIAWHALPAELGCGCGKTCRTHLQRWQRIGVWQSLQGVLQTRLPDAEQFDWSRAWTDGLGREPGSRRTRFGLVERTLCRLRDSCLPYPAPESAEPRLAPSGESVQGSAACSS
jgi:transposase